MVDQGFLIVFEGIDGSGKSTQAKLLARKLRQYGHEVVETREPTLGRWGLELRKSTMTGRFSQCEEIALFIKDRREHVDELIAPSLEQGKVVITDRYYLSTVAYQSAVLLPAFNVEELVAMNEEFAPKPDVVFMMCVDPVISTNRIRSRDGCENKFETMENLVRVKQIYQSLDFGNITHIDASKSIQEVQKEVLYTLFHRNFQREV